MDTAVPAASRGQLFVLSAPSGAGKTSITSRLRQLGVVNVSVSHTTRIPRAGEGEGDAYFFVSEEEFLAMRDAGRFLEWASVYGYYYGTDRAWVEAQLVAGNHVLLEIDCQGALEVRRLYCNVVMIFICPPDIETLRQRLLLRQQDDDETQKRRLAAAEEEMAQKNHFDYVIINSCLDDAVSEVAAVIHKHQSFHQARE